MILAGDVGATKVLLEAGDVDEGRWKPFLARRYAITDFSGMPALLEVFLDEWKAVKPSHARMTGGAIGVAGPAEGNCAQMTHRPWIVDGDALGDHFGIPRLLVVNDLMATASGIEMLSSRDFYTLQAGKAVEGAPQVVLGVGTGLGVAYRIKTADAPHKNGVIPGEGGHVGFSPASAEQAHLWVKLFEAHGRVGAGTVASGTGISHIHRALTGKTVEPAEITDARAMGLFTECLANIAGDHALSVMARGGVYLAGGVMAKIARTLDKEKFAAAFCAKGHMSSIMMKIPVRAITNERLAILGAAQLAK